MKKLIQKFRDGTIKEMLDELCWMQRYSKQYSWAIAWYVFVGIISSIVGLIASVLSKNIIDIVTGFQYGQILWVAITYVAHICFHQLGKHLCPGEALLGGAAVPCGRSVIVIGL